MSAAKPWTAAAGRRFCGGRSFLRAVRSSGGLEFRLQPARLAAELRTPPLRATGSKLPLPHSGSKLPQSTVLAPRSRTPARSSHWPHPYSRPASAHPFAVPSNCPHANPIAGPSAPQNRCPAAATCIFASASAILAPLGRDMPGAWSILVSSSSIHATAGSILQASPRIAPTAWANLPSPLCLLPPARCIRADALRHHVPLGANKLALPHRNVPARRRSPSVLPASHRRLSDAARRATFCIEPRAIG